MRILGIDCGTERTGWGVIESDGRRHRVVAHGVIRTAPPLALEIRLKNIAAGLRAILGEHRPEAAAVEEVFYSQNVKTALKLARQYQVEVGQSRRHQILSRQQSYHGATLGALSVSGNKRRRQIYLPMIREFSHIGTPYCYRCAFDCTDGCRNCGQEYAAELERAIEAGSGEIAAFIFEPVSGATLGAVVPPPGYLQSIAEICHRHGVLLIADEVMTGMGRTGRNLRSVTGMSSPTFWSPRKVSRAVMRLWAR